MQVNLIGVPVHTRDGQNAGKVWRVAVDPQSRRVTHVIIHQGALLGRNLVVPIEDATRVDASGITLELTLDGLARCPNYQETDFLPPEEGWEYPVGYPQSGIVWPLAMAWSGASTYPLMSNAVVKENIPPEDVTIAAGTSVECADGHCGRVERVVLDDQSHEIVGFVIRKGLIFTRDIQAPIDWVDHVDDAGVHLKLSRQEVEQRGGSPR
ncbi:MAG TPA: PRC-barrel domain-containing protein [Oscillatoriaceae cyanobacterium]